MIHITYWDYKDFKSAKNGITGKKKYLQKIVHFADFKFAKNHNLFFSFR